MNYTLDVWFNVWESEGINRRLFDIYKQHLSEMPQTNRQILQTLYRYERYGLNQIQANELQQELKNFKDNKLQHGVGYRKKRSKKRSKKSTKKRKSRRTRKSQKSRKSRRTRR